MPQRIKYKKNETRPPDRKLTSHFRVRQKDLVRKKNLAVKKKENGNDPSAKQSLSSRRVSQFGIAERETKNLGIIFKRITGNVCTRSFEKKRYSFLTYYFFRDDEKHAPLLFTYLYKVFGNIGRRELK